MERHGLTLFGGAAALLLSALTLLPAHGKDSSDDIWTTISAIPVPLSAGRAWVRPERYHAIRLQAAALTNRLARAPREEAVLAGAPPEELTLPLPEGGFARFHIAESPVMEPGLAEQFPDIRTYIGQGIDDPHATVRLDWTPAGFHAQVRSPEGGFYIDPWTQGDTQHYSSYRRRDLAAPPDAFECHFTSDETKPSRTTATTPGVLRAGPTLRTYRAAIAATGEYTSFHGGTVNLGLAAVVTALNRVNGIYEIELGIRMVLVANNQNLIFTSAASDGYSPNFPNLMLSQNQNKCDNVIGSANYDIGHVFSRGGGGLASLGCVCVGGRKAQGLTGNNSPVGDPFWVDFVAHEMGHQFGANHTFNGTGGSCSGGNRNGPTAYEPGSGSTIMAYAGICGSSDNLQSNSDAYFHFASFDEIIAYITTGAGNNCPVASPTTNQAPTVTAGPAYTIPRLTPFALTATGSDPDGDPLTYCWEQRDLGAAQAATSADNGTSPIIRSFPPTTNATRIVPRLSDLLANTNVLGEKLPNLARSMKFRVTARDNKPGGGGVNTDDVTITVVTSAGLFLVTAPNTALTWSAAVTCTWDVANTHLAPVNCSAVNILLSTNNGLAFPIALALGVPNTGTNLVILPGISTTNARIKVEAADNIFFDVSNTRFTITPGTGDNDNDGIPDAIELQVFGNLLVADAASDFDLDGFSDRDELFAGTDPKDPNSLFEATAATLPALNPGFVVRWASVSSRVYGVSRSTNLLAGFIPLATNLPATPPENVFTDSVPPSAQGLYRIDVTTP
ncbi:MAG TPA: M12 family metallo-peptidase [Kiritimatiellia bacterium]|nr:M12 family metallo-peptidase [Kiritimatiellia bacterium]